MKKPGLCHYRTTVPDVVTIDAGGNAGGMFAVGDCFQLEDQTAAGAPFFDSLQICEVGQQS